MADAKKINIKINDHKYADDKACLTIGFKGGFAEKEFLINGSETFSGNYAFFNVLFNCWRQTVRFPIMSYDVGRVSSIMSCQMRTDECAEILSAALKGIHENGFDRDSFENAKERTKKAFQERYMEDEFRARCKAFEFSDRNKSFSQRALTDDILGISFDEFQRCADTLLTPGNMLVHISGDFERLTDIGFSSVDMDIMTVSSTVEMLRRNRDPYLRHDAHLICQAKTDLSLTVLAFDFFDSHVPAEVKALLLSIFAEYLPYQSIEMSIDTNDASLMLENESPKPVKPLLKESLAITEYEQAKTRVLARYITLLEKQPDAYGAETAAFAAAGIDMNTFLQFVSVCDYDKFSEIRTKADCLISEAQVIMQKEE